MIHGKNIILRSVIETDLPLLFQWINSPEIVQWSSHFKPIHFNNHLEWFKGISQEKTKLVFAMCYKNLNNLIGLVQLIDLHLSFQSAELVIKICPQEYRSQGFGREAILLVLQYGWKELNLHRIWLRVFGDNRRAIASYKACGFKEEGCMRQAAYINGEWKDITIMGIIRN
jgi:diamine N-acetyltransferase